jgi:hypothetical protein
MNITILEVRKFRLLITMFGLSLLVPSFAAASSTQIDVTQFAWGSSLDAVTVTTTISNEGSDYLWQYNIQNISFTPGINVFDLAIDMSNPTLSSSFGYVQSNGWKINGVDKGIFGEWDQLGGPGIGTGSQLTFSFTTAPIGANSDASIGANQCNVGCWLLDASGNNGIFFNDPSVGPLIPDPNVPGTLTTVTPEPSSILLYLTGLVLIVGIFLRRSV